MYSRMRSCARLAVRFGAGSAGMVWSKAALPCQTISDPLSQEQLLTAGEEVEVNGIFEKWTRRAVRLP
jgi:hypothetical protein